MFWWILSVIRMRCYGFWRGPKDLAFSIIYLFSCFDWLFVHYCYDDQSGLLAPSLRTDRHRCRGVYCSGAAVRDELAIAPDLVLFDACSWYPGSSNGMKSLQPLVVRSLSWYKKVIDDDSDGYNVRLSLSNKYMTTPQMKTETMLKLDFFVNICFWRMTWMQPSRTRETK